MSLQNILNPALTSRYDIFIQGYVNFSLSIEDVT